MKLRIDHPYHNLKNKKRLRGNLHTHTVASDGDRKLQDVVNDYAERGYDFLMISDHDILTSRPEYRTIDAQRMVLIPGNEVSRDGQHLLHVNADRRVEPNRQRQQVLNEIARGRGFAIMNHPNWGGLFDHCPIDRLKNWVGYAGIEIYNGVVSRSAGDPYATGKWDMLLTEGLRVWGYANDDSHSATDVEMGWNVAWCDRRSVSGVVDALCNGRFYASTGVAIDEIIVSRGRITIRAANARRIVAIHDWGRRFATADGPSLTVTPSPKSKYVRFECWGDGEKFAWTQPFYLVHRDQG